MFVSTHCNNIEWIVIQLTNCTVNWGPVRFAPWRSWRVLWRPPPALMYDSVLVCVQATIAMVTPLCLEQIHYLLGPPPIFFHHLQQHSQGRVGRTNLSSRVSAHEQHRRWITCDGTYARSSKTARSVTTSRWAGPLISQTFVRRCARLTGCCACGHVLQAPCSWAGERCSAGWSTVASSAGNKLHDHLTCGQRASHTWCISDVRQPSRYCWQKHSLFLW